MSKGRAFGLDQRYRLGLTSKVVLGRVYPAVEREDDKAEAICLDIMLCALLLLPQKQQKDVVTKGVVCGVSAGALYAGGKDWKL
jgi:hypothetical protein